MLGQRRRDKRTGAPADAQLLGKQGFMPKMLVTDKLGSYGSAFRQLRLACPHEQGLRKNNRVEIPSSRAPTRAQDATVQVGRAAQRFLSMHAAVHNTFNLERHLISRSTL